MARELSIRIQIQDSDQARAALGQVEQGLKDVEAAGGKASATLGKPTDGPSAPTVIGGLRTMGLIVAGLGLTQAAKEAREYGSQLQDLKDKSGIGVVGLQNLNYAASQVGIGLEQAVAGINQLSRRIADGDKSAIGALKALGLAADDFKGKAPDEVFIAIAERISQIPAKGDQLVAAYDLMGKGGERLVPLITNVDLLKEHHQVMTQDVIEGLDRWDDFMATTTISIKSQIGNMIGSFFSFQGAVDQVFGLIAGNITGSQLKLSDNLKVWRAWGLEVVGYVQAVYQDSKTWLIDKWAAIPEYLLGFKNKTVGYFLELKTKAIGYATDLYTGVKTWLVDKWVAIVSGAKEKIDAVTGFFRDMYDKVVGHSYVPDMIREIGTEFGKLQANMVTPTQSALTIVAGAFVDWKSAVGTTLSDFIASLSGPGGYAEGLKNFASDFARDFVATTLDIMVPGLGQLVVQAWPIIEKGLIAIGKGIKSFFSGIWGWIKGLFGFGGSGDKNESPDERTGYNPDPNSTNNPYPPGYDPGNPDNPTQGDGGMQGDHTGGLDSGYSGYTAFARGGIVTRPTRALIGEAGPEAVVPLSSGGIGGHTFNVYAMDAQSFRDFLRRGGATEIVAAIPGVLGQFGFRTA